MFVDYKGLTVAEVSDLRNKFRAAGVEYKVYKNTLVRKAFNELGVTDFDKDLNGNGEQDEIPLAPETPLPI